MCGGIVFFTFSKKTDWILFEDMWGNGWYSVINIKPNWGHLQYLQSGSSAVHSFKANRKSMFLHTGGTRLVTEAGSALLVNQKPKP
jgi:hypothetical protein